MVHEPWFPDWFGDVLAGLITELEAGVPSSDGLGSKRKAFRTQGQIPGEDWEGSMPERLLATEQAFDQMLRQRSELLVGVQLLRAGVLTGMPHETPDFECRLGDRVFGVEVTTRTRQEAATALHDVLERGMWNGPDVLVTLKRTGELLFSISPEKTAEAGGRVIAQINELVAAAKGEPVFGSVQVPELRLSAVVQSNPGFCGPMMRVNFEPLLGEDMWDHHWTYAAKQIKDPIMKKRDKVHSVPSIVVMDVSRLGEAGRMPVGARRLFDVTAGAQPAEPWTNEFQQVLDGLELGKLRGALLVRSDLRSREMEPLCWRNGTDSDDLMAMASAAVVFGDQFAQVSAAMSGTS